jgi:hypothetical protein
MISDKQNKYKESKPTTKADKIRNLTFFMPPCSYVLFKTIDKSFRLNWPIGCNKNAGSIVFYRKNGLQDVRHAEKNQIVLKAQAVYYSLVSQQQKLCKAEQPKGQAPADAAFNGPQGRMAPLKALVKPQK